MNQSDRLTKKPKYWAITTAAVLVTAFVLVQPTMQTSYAQVSDLGVPVYQDCFFYTANQPEDPLSMTTVRVGQIAKTIIAEKEIFKCDTTQGNIDLIIDVTTIGEIYENMTTEEIILKQAEVITCAKLDPSGPQNATQTGNDGSVLGCDVYTPETDFVPVTHCFDLTSLYLTHPQEMNTVNKGNKVKTIIAQKEVFHCTFGIADTRYQPAETRDDKKIEQYIIEEIWESLGLLPDNPVVQKNVESLRCVTLIHTATVESCQFRPVPVQELK